MPRAEPPGAGKASGAAAGERGEVQQVLDGIRRIVQSLRQSSHDAERRSGLTAAQLFVLAKLGETGCSSLNELADRTFTHQSTVSTVVSRLVERRLIARESSAEDRRRLTLALTARGRRVLASAPDAAQERLIAAIGALPAGTRQALGQTLGDLSRALADPRQPTRMFFDDATDTAGQADSAAVPPDAVPPDAVPRAAVSRVSVSQAAAPQAPRARARRSPAGRASR